VTIDVTGGAPTRAKQAARGDRQLAAREDRRARRGSELGTAGRRRRARRRRLQLERARVQIGDVELFAGGRPFDERAPQASEHSAGHDVSLRVDLGTGGGGAARMWTCDLSADYVKINAEYRT
jgi:N-acetylglutamate synthase/N-acetylornithine aminotransferase